MPCPPAIFSGFGVLGLLHVVCVCVCVCVVCTCVCTHVLSAQRGISLRQCKMMIKRRYCHHRNHCHQTKPHQDKLNNAKPHTTTDFDMCIWLIRSFALSFHLCPYTWRIHSPSLPCMQFLTQFSHLSLYMTYTQYPPPSAPHQWVGFPCWPWILTCSPPLF